VVCKMQFGSRGSKFVVLSLSVSERYITLLHACMQSQLHVGACELINRQRDGQQAAEAAASAAVAGAKYYLRGGSH